jgi:hypothetical protein
MDAMKPNLPRAPLLAATLGLMRLSPAAHASDGGGWDWIVAPYVWMVNIQTDLGLDVAPPGGLDGDLDYPDVLSDLDGAFEVHAEGQGDDFGMFADFTFLGLADERDFDRFDSETDMDQRLFEAALVWSPGDERYQGLEVFGGLRYVDLDTTIELDPTNPDFGTTTFDSGNTYSDFMLGARYTFDLSERWGLTLRGDGSFGETEGTWNASAIANFKTNSGAWFFGYRYLEGELESDAGRTLDVTLHGAILGYGFMF